MTLLELDRVSYAYPDAAVPALRDVTLTVAPGEFVVLAGGSAAGKSTLLRAAAGLVPHFHGGTFAGEVRCGGLSTRDHGPAELSAVAGSLFQDPETQVVMGSVRAEIAFPLEGRGDSAAAVARGVEEVALALGIADLLDRRTGDLSGGELQRVVLAAALARRPPLLLLDEPTSQLDPVAGDELIWLLRRLNEEWGTAIVLAEHRLERCLAAADRVVALRGGGVACDTTPEGFQAWAVGHAPELATPAATLFAAAGLHPLPSGVKQARRTLAELGLSPDAQPAADLAAPSRADRRRRRKDAALRMDGVWHELRDGPSLLRGIDLVVGPGELVVVMGRNGAGKSTLLRHAAGLLQPTRGRVQAAGRVALLLQNPGDYILHERVADEAPAAALRAVGLTELAARHPRDLSGGERQRLALAIVLGAGAGDAAAVCLDEPTRGMDRADKAALAGRLRGLAADGRAVLVATHDAEFAATVGERVVLLADGRVIADGPVAELLGGGWYFATETARILGGAGGALLPADGARLLRATTTIEVP
ncbi:MAG: energy-coupling factor transport system ATP-binding protein [Solirubrobacteraceae bacterium]|nr:energy-coupling factor transport system ATP-binding protein [Solirubrobacteraceae bacterium]